MNLPTTTRGSTVPVYVPNTKAVVNAMEVAKTPESARHLSKSFANKMQSSGPQMVERSQGMQKTLDDHSMNMQLQRAANGNHWRGMVPQTNYNTYQDGVANRASEKLRTNHVEEVKIDLAVSGSSQLLRAFTANDNPLNMDSQILCDELLGSFFAKNNLFAQVTEEGTFIYESDANGEIRMDRNNRPIQADSEVVREVLNNRNRGLQAYLKEHGINSSTRLHPYPEEAPRAEPTQKTEPKAAEPTAAKPATPSDQPTPG